MPRPGGGYRPESLRSAAAAAAAAATAKHGSSNPITVPVLRVRKNTAGVQATSTWRLKQSQPTEDHTRSTRNAELRASVEHVQQKIQGRSFPVNNRAEEPSSRATNTNKFTAERVNAHTSMYTRAVSPTANTHARPFSAHVRTSPTVFSQIARPTTAPSASQQHQTTEIAQDDGAKYRGRSPARIVVQTRTVSESNAHLRSNALFDKGTADDSVGQSCGGNSQRRYV
jgi:hypothetical protein